MSLPDPANRLHRSIKLALDSGEASSYEMAHQIFSQYQVALEIGPNVAQSATLQAAVLTVVNVARRCFLGGVNVSGYTDFPLTTPGWRGERLSTAIARHGGLFTSSTPSNVPRIIIGNELPGVIRSGIAIRGTFDGWLAAVAPPLFAPEAACTVPAEMLRLLSPFWPVALADPETVVPPPVLLMLVTFAESRVALLFPCVSAPPVAMP